MEIQQRRKAGQSISQIAREEGVDRKTIKKWLSTQPDAKPQYKRKGRDKKLDPYKEYIMSRISEGVYNATVMYRELKELGFKGSYSTLKVYMRPFRNQARVVASRRYETAAGEQGQMDFGSFGTIELEDGQKKPLYAFVFVLGYSRAMHVEFITDQTIATVLNSHKKCFEALGGAPRRVLYDNFKAAVIGRDNEGQPLWHAQLEGFLKAIGSRPTACKPRRPQCKGKVESGVKYVRRNFWPGRHFTTLEDLNHQVQAWVDQVAHARIHGTTHELPGDRLRQEQEHLLSLAPLGSYKAPIQVERKVTFDAFVHYLTCRYSVPWSYAGQRVSLRQEKEQLFISFKGVVIAEHALSAKRHSSMVIAAHHTGIPVQPAQDPQKDPCIHQVQVPEVQVRSLAAYEREVSDELD